jgi:serine protease Do
MRPSPRLLAAVLLALGASAGTVPASWAAADRSPSAAVADLQAHVKATAARVLPAVVNIASTVVVRDQPFGDEGLPFGLFEGQGPRRERGQGSGVIVTPDGYILTNHHVVANATAVEVLLGDRRQFKGRVVASDPKTDVAVVRINATGLPTVRWGDSSKLGVGDFVLAVGNPLGLTQTVTFGIVSAVGRADVGIADFEDFIQTDAPINPGNSGGALVNVRGELVGMNTAIASASGGSIGVGFAVPSNMCRAVMHSLLKTGRVVRGFLGATTQDVNPLLGKLFRLPDVKGAIVTDLMEDGSAQKAGLRRGDVVVRFDGKDVTDSGRLRNFLGTAAIGSRHLLDIVRDGRPAEVELVVQEAPGERRRSTPAPVQAGTPTHPLRGIQVEEVTPAAGRQLGLGSRHSLVIAAVEEGSAAEAAGVMVGDVLLEVNRKPIADLRVYQQVTEAVKLRAPALLLIERQGTVLYVPIEGE